MKVYTERDRNGKVLSTRYDIENDGDEAIIKAMRERGDAMTSDGDGRYWNYENSNGANDPLHVEACSRK